MTVDHRASLSALKPLAEAIARGGRYRVLSRDRQSKVKNGSSVNLDSELGGAGSDGCDFGTRYQALCGRAPAIDAGATQKTALDQTDTSAGASQANGQRRPCLSGANDDFVKMHHRQATMTTPLPIAITSSISAA